jgi:hypothetical protein
MKAWKRRVQQGLLAKDGGGAICRHHPRLGRRGKDLILNRKGHILGGTIVIYIIMTIYFILSALYI